LVRVHLRNTLCDLPGILHEECGWPLRDILRRISEEGKGVVVILQQQESAEQLIHKIQNYCRLEQGEDLPAHPNSEDLRTFGLGAQILADLGVRKMRVLSAPKKLHAISGFNLEVVDYVHEEK
jgi:3,4-dihydroxy 2-butanone 4-phosphate synthase/GTP cyclohydrolase II